MCAYNLTLRKVSNSKGPIHLHVKTKGTDTVTGIELRFFFFLNVIHSNIGGERVTVTVQKCTIRVITLPEFF